MRLLLAIAALFLIPASACAQPGSAASPSGTLELGDRAERHAGPRPARDQPPVGQQPLDQRHYCRSRVSAGPRRRSARRQRPGPLPDRPRRRRARLRGHRPPRARHRRLRLPRRRAVRRRSCRARHRPAHGRRAIFDDHARYRPCLCRRGTAPELRHARPRPSSPRPAIMASRSTYLRGMGGHGYRVGRLAALDPDARSRRHARLYRGARPPRRPRHPARRDRPAARSWRLGRLCRRAQRSSAIAAFPPTR